MAVGDGKVEGETLEMKLQPGTTVLYGRFGIGCTDVEVNGQPHLLIREDDCIGVMPKSDVNAADIPQMQPVGTRVLVRVTEESDVTVGGVLLPSAAKEKPVMGEVVAVGWGTKASPVTVGACALPLPRRGSVPRGRRRLARAGRADGAPGGRQGRVLQVRRGSPRNAGREEVRGAAAERRPLQGLEP